MAEINGEEGTAGHRVRRVRGHLDAPNCEAHSVGLVYHEPFEDTDHGDRGREGIAPPAPGRRARMRGLTENLDAEPAQTLDRGHSTDHLVHRLENRSLLDMGLDIGGDRKTEL